MHNSNIRRLMDELQAEVDKQRRHYKLDDRFAVRVSHRDYLDADWPPHARVHVYEKTETTSSSGTEVDWECIDYESVPALLLHRVAELKVIVERYNHGELAELPPSTMDDFLAEQDERRREGRRRRLRRY